MAAIDEKAWNDQDDQQDKKDQTDNFLNDDNLDPAYDNTLGDDIAFDRNYDESEGKGFDEDKDFEAHLAPESVDPDPNEIPEKQESEQEGSGYTPSREYSQPQEGNDTSYHEQTGVTPPNQPEVPGTSPAEAYRTGDNHGRTTGRMVGHEPGIEGGV